MEAKDWAFVFPDSKRKQEQGQFMTCDAFNMKNKSTSLDKAKLQSNFFVPFQNEGVARYKCHIQG